MKVVLNNGEDRKPKPILPLVGEEDDGKVPKTKVHTYDLLTDPTDAASPKYKLTIRILDGTESLRTTLKWRQDIETVINGLALTNEHVKTSTVTKQLLNGTAKAAFIAKQQAMAEATREEAAEAARA